MKITHQYLNEFQPFILQIEISSPNEFRALRHLCGKCTDSEENKARCSVLETMKCVAGEIERELSKIHCIINP